MAPSLHEQYMPLLPTLHELKELLVRNGAVSCTKLESNPIPMQDVHNISMPEAAQRWLQHHSALQPGDAVILGAATPKQMEDNIVQWCVLLPSRRHSPTVFISVP
jgi:aflatoxin B1 aldehyde reductase